MSKTVEAKLRNCPWCFCKMHIELHGNMYYPIGDHGENCILEGSDIAYIGSAQGLKDLISNWNCDGEATNNVKLNHQDQRKWNKLGFGD